MLRLHAPETKSVTSAVLSSALPAGASTLDTNSVPIPAIEDYIAELRAGLRRAGSEQSATETCEEVRQHLIASVQARIEMGAHAEVAVADALRRFGGVAQHRVSLHREMRRTARRTNPQAAFRFALALYGGVCALDLLGAALFAIASEINFQSLLPFWEGYAIYWLLLGSPLVTGCIVGRQTGRLALRATCRVQLPIIGSLLLTSGLAYLVVLAANLLLAGKEVEPFQQWPVYLPFGLACYYAIRFPLSLIAAWLTGRPRRRSSSLAEG